MNKTRLIKRIYFLILLLIVASAGAACGQSDAAAPVAEQPAGESVSEAANEAAAPSAEEPVIEPTEEVIMEPTAEPIDAVEQSGAENVQILASFDPSLLEFPEGIAVDKNDNIYVSLGVPFWLPDMEYFGEVRMISQSGTETLLTKIDGPSPAGLAVNADGALYYAYPSGDENTQGVYRLMTDGEDERLPGTESIILANGLTVSEQGDLFATDSVLGAVWRMPADGSSPAEIWFQHELLTGCPEDPIGANGIAFEGQSLLVASTVRGLLVRVPVEADGGPGEPEIVAGVDDCDPEYDDLDSIDGIALDSEGSVYAFLVMKNQLVRIDPQSGAVDVLLSDTDGLHNPASIVFGASPESRESIYFTNFAVLPPAPAGSLGPGVLKLDVGAGLSQMN